MDDPDGIDAIELGPPRLLIGDDATDTELPKVLVCRGAFNESIADVPDIEDGVTMVELLRMLDPKGAWNVLITAVPEDDPNEVNVANVDPIEDNGLFVDVEIDVR
jgi:hypothetical protein